MMTKTINPRPTDVLQICCDMQFTIPTSRGRLLQGTVLNFDFFIHSVCLLTANMKTCGSEA